MASAILFGIKRALDNVPGIEICLPEDFPLWGDEAGYAAVGAADNPAPRLNSPEHGKIEMLIRAG